MEKGIKQISIVRTEAQVIGFDLFLTVEEALTLGIILDKIGGCPTDSLRRYTAQIEHKLLTQGLTGLENFSLDEMQDIAYGSITFSGTSTRSARFNAVVDKIVDQK